MLLSERDFNAKAKARLKLALQVSPRALFESTHTAPWDTFLKEGVTLRNLPEKENHEKQERKKCSGKGRKE